MLQNIWQEYGFDRFGAFAEAFRSLTFRMYLESGSEELTDLSWENNESARGLVRGTVRGMFPKLGANAEYRLTLDPENGVISAEGTLTSEQNTGTRLRGPFSMGITFGIQALDTLRMYRMAGGKSTSSEFPPQAYAYVGCDREFSILSSTSGRSTDGTMPFAIVTDENETCGVLTAEEWSGRWIFCPIPGKDADGKPQMTLLWQQWGSLFSIPAGESAAIPGCSFCLFQGKPIDGSNAFRRYLQKVKGSAELPVFYNHYFYFGNNFDENILKEEADFYAKVGCEYFVVDGGWHKDGFRAGIGNWYTPDPAKFPSGLRHFSDYVHSLGMKFGLWFEPEFAMQDSEWCQKYPQYYMDAGNRFDIILGKPYPDRLFRMDLPEARDVLAKELTQLFHDWRIDWVRFDFNNAPGDFWDANDTPKNYGRLQNRYCRGLYAFYDEIKRNNPNLHIETCAAGGCRMDLGLLRRADSAWMSDLVLPSENVRRYQVNLNRFVPGMANSIYVTENPHPEDGSLSFGTEAFPWENLLSKFAGPFGFSEKASHYSQKGVEQLRQFVKCYREYRRYLAKDFYPLCEPQSLKDWDGWQFHDPETDSGIAAFFRNRSEKAQHGFALYHLPSNADFRVLCGDSGLIQSCENGTISVTLEKSQCILVFYHG